MQQWLKIIDTLHATLQAKKDHFHGCLDSDDDEIDDSKKHTDMYADINAHIYREEAERARRAAQRHGDNRRSSEKVIHLANLLLSKPIVLAELGIGAMMIRKILA